MAMYCCRACASYASSTGRLNLNTHLMRETSTASLRPNSATLKSLHRLTKPLRCWTRKASQRLDSPRSLYLIATPEAFAAKLSSDRSGIWLMVWSSAVRSSTRTCTELSSMALVRKDRSASLGSPMTFWSLRRVMLSLTSSAVSPNQKPLLTRYASANLSLSITRSDITWLSASWMGMTPSKSPKASLLLRYSMRGTRSNPCGTLSPLLHPLPDSPCVHVVLSALSYTSR